MRNRASLCQFLLPHLILDVLHTDLETNEVTKSAIGSTSCLHGVILEFLCVLNDDKASVLHPADKQIAAQAIFGLIDTLNKWLAEANKQSFRERNKYPSH